MTKFYRLGVGLVLGLIILIAVALVIGRLGVAERLIHWLFGGLVITFLILTVNLFTHER